MSTQFKEIFKNGSKTYFNASRFFPQEIKNDVYTLYAFVRVADNFVDKIPQDIVGLKKYRDMALGHKKLKGNNGQIIKSFLELSQRMKFDEKWTEAFLNSMLEDSKNGNYDSLLETEKYMYGSAEVVGLWMARILNLPTDSYKYARLLGKYFQYINFIRDIDEDNYLKRKYIPRVFLDKHKLSSLKKEAVFMKKKQFEELIREEVQRSLTWREEALKGFQYIPYKYRIAISTADKMYYWTARKIYANPMIVFEKKVKPSKLRILTSGFLSMLYEIRF